MSNNVQRPAVRRTPKWVEMVSTLTDKAEGGDMVSTCGESPQQFIRERSWLNEPRRRHLKRLPFRNNFQDFTITDPYQIWEGFEHGIETPEVEGIIVDSLTFMMDMFESMHVITAADTRAAWGDYQQFFKRLMQDYVPNFNRPVIFTAHTRTDHDEATMSMRTAVPVKGALRGVGIESFFSTIVATKVVPLKDLEPYENDMLHITDDDRVVDYKHVFQTRHTKKSSGERIRSPIGFFDVSETFIDNDCQQLLDHLNKLYNA